MAHWLADIALSMASWIQSPSPATRTQWHPRRNSHSPGTGAAAALQLRKGPTLMMYGLNLAMFLTSGAAAALGAVYVWSKDQGRRERAWALLRLLFRR